MKKYYWLIGLALMVLSGFGYAYAAFLSDSQAWIGSTVLVVMGGVVLVYGYLVYHKMK